MPLERAGRGRGVCSIKFVIVVANATTCTNPKPNASYAVALAELPATLRRLLERQIEDLHTILQQELPKR